MAIQSSFKEKTADKVKEPKHYKVIMYNDDFTTMDFVVEVLVTIFKKETSLSYKPIDESLAVRIRPEESRSFLKDMGIDGEMFSTPSHSKDSISLILEEGTCFVGNIYHLWRKSKQCIRQSRWEKKNIFSERGHITIRDINDYPGWIS